MSSLSSSLKNGRKKVISLLLAGKMVLASSACLAGNSSTANSSDEVFSQWKKQYGKTLSMSEWSKNNPMPALGSSPNSVEALRRWHISLGPLGVNTLMHDRTWAGSSKAAQEVAPIELVDECGQIKNAYQVTIVKTGGPAEGILKKGDLILQMDGQDLKEAHLTYVGTPLGYKNARGLDISAGQMIDKAEGRGKIKLTVLRVPQDKKKELQKALKGIRSWKTIKEVSSGNFTVMLENVDMIRIKARYKKGLDSLTLSNGKGITFPTKIGRKTLLNVSIPIPPGKWLLRGTSVSTEGKSAKMTVQAVAPAKLPKAFTKYLKHLELKLPKIGSFGKNFDPNGEKARNYSKIVAHRLAAQQSPNGAWNGKRSYGSNTFYTSICALGLLSTGDSQYKMHIRKAAHYVANATWGKWTYIAGLSLTFLAEYYLRTRDKTIIPGLKIHISQVHAFVLGDYTAGHSITKPGYGGRGWIGGGGMIACGLAAASRTGLTSLEDDLLLDKMLNRVQEIAPAGKVPYSRQGGKSTEPAKGQSGSCATGPYFFASLIRGGADHFTKTAAKRYSTAPWGTAEGGHATQTIHFVWGVLASANCGSEALRGSMNAYLWKFTLLRNFDGFIANNNYRLEYHGGDGIIGVPFWRTGGYLLLMNAGKRNLAITGSSKYRAKELIKTPIVFHAHKKFFNYVQRSWYVAESALGKSAPKSLKQAIAKLDAFPKDTKLGENVSKLLKAYAPRLAKDILAIKKNGVNSAQLVEMIYGVSLSASCTPFFPDEVGGEALATDFQSNGSTKEPKSKSAKRSAKRAMVNRRKKMSEEDRKAARKADAKKEKAAKGARKKIQSNIKKGTSMDVLHMITMKPVALLTKEGSNKKDTVFESSLFDISDIDITISDPTRRYIKKPLHYKPSALEAGLVYKVPMKTSDKGSFDVAVKYKLNGHKISYDTKLYYPSLQIRHFVPSLNRIKVKGTVIEDYRGKYTCRVKLDTGRIVGCEQPLGVGVILAGTACEFEISPTKKWGYNIRSVKKIKRNNRIAIPSSVKIEGAKYVGDSKSLFDGDASTYISFGKGGEAAKGKKKGGSPGVVTFTYNFAKPVQITSGVFLIKGVITKPPLKVEAYVAGEWKVIREKYKHNYFNTLLAKSNKFRITLQLSRGGVDLAELSLNKEAAKRSAEQIKKEYTW
ncbi:MAG: hypothetical protein HRT88_02860 [Lentisphaeraceae bacterium]|nr:hypothetical protein [Lentisphaeraceae bacterium]